VCVDVEKFWLSMRVFGHVLSSPLDDEKEVVKSADFSDFDTKLATCNKAKFLILIGSSPPLSFSAQQYLSSKVGNHITRDLARVI
jgi:hypothetical protein